MSMLADRKRKEKYFINPTTPIWSMGENTNAQKLMKKMGWTEGEGLGKNSQGTTEPIKLQLKKDTKGVGYKRNKGDGWLANNDAFEDVLSNLQEISNASTPVVSHTNSPSQSEDESKSISSLEAKSKKSRARVHYHKFTRGKDVSNFSEDDLACILGKKQLLKKKEKSEPLEVEEKKEEVVTINRGSITDYFAQKLAALKAKKIIQNETANQLFDGEENQFENENENGTKHFSKENKQNIIENVSFDIDTEEAISKKKTKTDSSYNSEIFENSSKKTKSHIDNEELQDVEITEKKLKKRKKSDNASISHEENSEDTESSKRKKKKVKKNSSEENIEIDSNEKNEEDSSVSIVSKKKKKKSKKHN